MAGDDVFRHPTDDTWLVMRGWVHIHAPDARTAIEAAKDQPHNFATAAHKHEPSQITDGQCRFCGVSLGSKERPTPTKPRWFSWLRAVKSWVMWIVLTQVLCALLVLAPSEIPVISKISLMVTPLTIYFMAYQFGRKDAFEDMVASHQETLEPYVGKVKEKQS